MDKELIISSVKKLKLSVIILAAGLCICGFLFTKLVPEVKNFISKNREVTQQTNANAEDTKKLEELKKSAQKKSEENNKSSKEIYKPLETGLSPESAIAEEFEDILQLLRANYIKARSVKYNYNPSNDNFVSKAANKYNVCLLNFELIADYKHFQSFLSDLYKHEHFLDISDIECIPYEKDKKVLLIKSNIKLYAEKNGAVSVSNEPQAAETQAQDEVQNKVQNDENPAEKQAAKKKSKK